MDLALHGRRLAAMALLAGALAPPPARPDPGGGSAHIMPVRPPGTVQNAAPAGAHLSYYGGPVISNVDVVMVLYGVPSSTAIYEPFVQGTVTPNVATFYAGIPTGAYMDWLTEYDTNVAPVGGGSGTNQTIGRGTFFRQIAIAPSAANDGSTIDDTQIQAELLAQINAKVVPAPVTDAAGNVNTLYMIHFPKGKTITQGGTSSCVAKGFCAYHNTFMPASQYIYYGVLPDMSLGSGCDTACGSSPLPFDNQTSVASHELIEAVTDAAVGLATGLGRPLAWYDQTNNAEIGDLCNAKQGTYVGADGVTYTVQLEWSNAANTCYVPPVPPANDFSIAVFPSSRAMMRGSSATYAVSTAVTGGSAQTVTFSASGLPAGLTASFSPASAAAGGGSTLTLSASGTAAFQTTTFAVDGTSASATHSASASATVMAPLAIAPPAPTLPPRATQPFAGSGGSGAGYAWSLATNGSGGTIDAATGAYRVGSAGGTSDVVELTDSLGDTASATVSVTAGVSIGPATATLAPQAPQAFAASGGSGTGYVWSISTNASGGTIDAATGAYRAGAKGSVTDVVSVADSLGNTATASVKITAAVTGCGCGAGGAPEAGSLALLLLALLWRPHGPRAARAPVASRRARKPR